MKVQDHNRVVEKMAQATIRLMRFHISKLRRLANDTERELTRVQLVEMILLNENLLTRRIQYGKAVNHVYESKCIEKVISMLP